MTTFTGTIPTIASGDTTTVPTNLATYRDALKGLSESWTSYAPTYTNFTIGNGSVVAAYSRVNKLVTFRVRISFGSTSSVAGAMAISLPPSATSTGIPQVTAAFVGSNAGAAPFSATGYIPNSSTSVQVFLPTSTTNNTAVQLGSVALTMGAGAYIIVQGSYEAV